jgi:methylated-DNA-[protein]-cysteine S-methyltransferase
MTLFVTTTQTDAAPWTVVADQDGVVVASGFDHPDAVVARLTAAQRSAGVTTVTDLGPVSAAMRRYLAGDGEALDTVAVSQPGGPFQQEVWQALRAIPAGETWSYAGLATKAGRPAATRAAGSACARNQVAPFVPCHRVVRSDGTLGGYAYGSDVKRWLLALEASTAR